MKKKKEEWNGSIISRSLKISFIKFGGKNVVLVHTWTYASKHILAHSFSLSLARSLSLSPETTGTPHRVCLYASVKLLNTMRSMNECGYNVWNCVSNAIRCPCPLWTCVCATDASNFTLCISYFLFSRIDVVVVVVIIGVVVVAHGTHWCVAVYSLYSKCSIGMVPIHWHLFLAATQSNPRISHHNNNNNSNE